MSDHGQTRAVADGRRILEQYIELTHAQNVAIGLSAGYLIKDVISYLHALRGMGCVEDAMKTAGFTQEEIRRESNHQPEGQRPSHEDTPS
jgi:hypothetical protein